MTPVRRLSRWVGFSLAFLDWQPTCCLELLMNNSRVSLGARFAAAAGTVEIPRCPINVAARRAGLTAHVIRAWERRYAAIVPDRTGKGRRLYSDAEVQRLVMLRQAVELGHRISEVAVLPVDELRRLIGAETVPGVEASPRIPLAPARLLDLVVEQTRELDAAGLQQSLLQVTRTLTGPALFDAFLLPLQAELRRQRAQHGLGAVALAFAERELDRFVADLLAVRSLHPLKAVALVWAGSGEQTLAALCSAVTAQREGWTVVEVGSAPSADEVAAAAAQRRVQALIAALPSAGALASLRAALHEDIALIAVGREAAAAVHEATRDRVYGVASQQALAERLAADAGATPE